MKRAVILGLTIVLGLLAVVIAIPVLAEDSNDGTAPPAPQDAWTRMREACQNGDWETMAEVCPVKDLQNMPCLGGVTGTVSDSENTGWRGGRMCPMGGGTTGGSAASGGGGGNNSTGGSCH
ncbi:MAG: hypothetical protein FJZ95_02945 [Chloroflexi bacterium]|nr:hypothetical protein [Chloroflexota bacterium]